MPVPLPPPLSSSSPSPESNRNACSTGSSAPLPPQGLTELAAQDAEGKTEDIKLKVITTRVGGVGTSRGGEVDFVGDAMIIPCGGGTALEVPPSPITSPRNSLSETSDSATI